MFFVQVEFPCDDESVFSKWCLLATRNACSVEYSDGNIRVTGKDKTKADADRIIALVEEYPVHSVYLQGGTD